MKKIINGLAILIGIFILFFGGVFLYFMNIDFIGDKDPKTVKENVVAMNKTLLKARYFSATEECQITLADSTNIEITVGTNAGYSIIFRKYYISGDTIVIKENDNNKYENQEIEKYITAKKMLIKDDVVLFQLNKNNQYSTTKTMKIELNKL